MRRGRHIGPQHPIAIDDLTGFKVDYTKLRRQWDGRWAIDPDRRNPQDTIRARADNPKLDHPRPEALDTFLATNITMEDGVTPIIAENGTAILTEGPLNGAGL